MPGNAICAAKRKIIDLLRSTWGFAGKSEPLLLAKRIDCAGLSGVCEVGRPRGWFTDIRKRAVWSRAGDMIRNRRAMRVEKAQTMRAENFEHVGECMKHVR